MSGSTAFAVPTCSIEVYPFEGGPLTIQGGEILRVVVRKDIEGDGVGTFSIQLAPGGPEGTESPVTWSQILTPMSHIIIGMSRGTQAAVVMNGPLLAPSETINWSTNPERGSRATRNQGFSGADFGWFFRSFNYYALTFLGLTAGTPVGSSLDFLPGSLAQFSNQGIVGGNSSANGGPVQVGKTWYDKVMVGDNGILAKTFVPYAGGNRISFNDAMNRIWEVYPDVFIPLTDNFMTGQETWMDKFQSIFPMPWYEFFVVTAPANIYVPTGAETEPGSLFTMQTQPLAPPAGPQLVARVNPIPRFGAESLSTESIIAGSLDVSRWNALPLFDFTQAPFGSYEISIGFSADTARNFYQLNPTGFSQIFGSNANATPLPWLYTCACDPASVQRYGFRPQLGTTRWLFDPLGNAAQGDLDVQKTVLELTGTLISQYHPLPLMARAEVVIPLSPTILVGTRFRCAPYKNQNETWDFYIRAFEHVFEFGGICYTRLTLTRGLPTDVYQDASDEGILRAIYTGNAMRENGEYVIGLPAGTELPLQIVNTQPQIADLASHLSQVFVTPQTGAS